MEERKVRQIARQIEGGWIKEERKVRQIERQIERWIDGRNEGKIDRGMDGWKKGK